jgi:LmbE family N-acetylglucosaminyl deacetylase
MITTNLAGVRRILCIGAHSDDIEIGCGGTILQLLAGAKQLEIYWVVLCSNDQRAKEAQRSANTFLKGVKKKTIVVKSFRDGFLPYIGGGVKEFFEELKKSYSPDLIFTHFRNDLHQDHRLTSELTWNTFRNHLILEYEIPKYDADLQHPNFFVPLSDAVRRKKVRHLMDHFATQRNKHWFTEDLFNGLMRLRGMESVSPTLHAEGFHCRKIVLDALD